MSDASSRNLSSWSGGSINTRRGIESHVYRGSPPSEPAGASGRTGHGSSRRMAQTYRRHSGEAGEGHFPVMSGTGRFGVGARAPPRAPPAPPPVPPTPWQEPGSEARRERDMSDMQFLLLASELRTRAEEVLVRAANTNDLEVQGMMRVVAAGYQKLARQAEQRVREADKA